MRGLAKMLTEIAQRFAGLCVFRLCYIAEAHAADEWPVLSDRFNGDRGPVVVEQPKTTAERSALALQFARDFELSGMDVVVDVPETRDEFEKHYAPWPLRFYHVDADNTMLWVAEPKDCSFAEALFELVQRLEMYE